MNQDQESKIKKDTGFRRMDSERRREAAKKGGKQSGAVRRKKAEEFVTQGETALVKWIEWAVQLVKSGAVKSLTPNDFYKMTMAQVNMQLAIERTQKRLSPEYAEFLKQQFEQEVAEKLGPEYVPRPRQEVKENTEPLKPAQDPSPQPEAKKADSSKSGPRPGGARHVSEATPEPPSATYFESPEEELARLRRQSEYNRRREEQQFWETHEGI